MASSRRMFTCTFSPCEYNSSSFFRFLNHVWDKHSSQSTFRYRCNISSCPKVYTCIRSYRRHVKSNHSWFHEKYAKQRGGAGGGGDCRQHNEEVIETPFTLDGSSDTQCESEPLVDDVDSDGEPPHPANTIDFNGVVSSIILELREVYNVSTEATCFISEKFMYLFENDRKYFSNTLSACLKQKHPDIVLDFEVQANLSCKSEYAVALSKFSGQKSLSNYISEKESYVKPVEITLGYDSESKKYDNYQYVPILSTLDVLLKHEDVLGEMLKCREAATNGRLHEFSDSKLYSQNNLFDSVKNTVEIVLYHDDFNVVNPLGNKTVKYKVSAFYFVLGNLSAKNRSRLKDIQLLILSPASLIKKYGYKTLLEPLIKDLQRLEEEGIKVRFEGVSHLFFGTVSMIVADNLAAHALGGFQCSFGNVHRFCRFCNCVKSQRSKNTSSRDFTLRTKAAYNSNVAAIETDPSFSSVYGINHDSCFNQLQFFHVTSGLPPDIAHDVFEGFAVDLVTNVIVYFVREKYLTLLDFNTRIRTFSYANIDKKNKPQVVKIKPLTKFRVKQTACEMWNLLRLLPHMISDLIPVNEPVWIVYVEFLGILERLCAPHFHKDELIVLESLIDDFFQQYLHVFPEEELKPKAHFLKHYPEMIRRFGPLIKTLRFEAKNGYFKTCVAQAKNHRNMCLTMSKRHQMLMYLNYDKHTFLDPKEPQGIYSKEVSVEFFENDAKDLLKDSLYLDEMDLFTVSKAAVINGQRYSEADVVILSFQKDEYVFGLLKHIIFFRNVQYFLCQVLYIQSFNTHLHAYEVFPSDLWSVKKYGDLLDFHPLGQYENCNKTYVSLRYYVPEEE